MKKIFVVLATILLTVAISANATVKAPGYNPNSVSLSANQTFTGAQTFGPGTVTFPDGSTFSTTTDTFATVPIFSNVGGKSIQAATGTFLSLSTSTGNPGELAQAGTAAFYWNATDIYPATAPGTLGANTPYLSVNTAGLISKGTKFTTTGCSVSATIGGATAGTYTSGTTGACPVVITMNGATGLSAPNGWACTASDRTTTANGQQNTASTATTATISGTTVTGDVISFHCTGY